MRRDAYHNLICLVSLLILAAWVTAQGFDFNDGTVQGWTLQGAYDEDGDGPFANNFSATFSWKDPVNYPGIPGSDASGDNEGSMQMFGGLHGITNPGAAWWIMRFYSPDLSSDPEWQYAEGFTVKIAECMTTSFSTLYANLYVVVYDEDLGYDRYFYNGSAQVLDHCIYGSQNIWNTETLDWSGIGSFPTNYTIKHVFINIWGRMNEAYEGGLYVDEVQPIPPPTPIPPSNLQAHKTSPQIHVTWDDNSSNEDGFVIQYKSWYYLSLEPSTWNTLNTVGPDVTSYQMDGPKLNYYYKYRVYAYNGAGDSDVSNAATVLSGLTLNWIRINSPNGGETFAQGSTQTIDWSTGTGILQVKIEYSTDGGNNWISPPIVSSTSNDGEYDWTIPATLSGNCLLKVSEVFNSDLYDISNTPFSIVAPAPDLVVESLTCDQQDTAVQDQELQLHCTIKNQGSLSSGWFYMYWYADKEIPPAPGELGDRNWYIPGGLIPGGTYTVDFTYTYDRPGTKNMYFWVDSTSACTEADETNNILGPQSLDVREFEFIEETSNASLFFGYHQNNVYNVGVGQGLTLPRSAYASYAGFRFTGDFDYSNSPTGGGHAVTLTLDVRDASGTVVKSVTEYVPADFTGGWVLFDLDMDLWAGREYIFTCYLQDAPTNELCSGVYARSDDPWPDSTGYRALDYSPFNIEEWSSWSTHTWDFNFRIAGVYTDLSPVDFDHSYLVNLADYACFAERWLDSCILPEWCEQADTDYSGAVDLPDLEQVGADWLWSGYGALDRAAIAAMAGQLSTASISGSDGEEFRPGTYFIYQTDEGRFGKCIAEHYDPTSHALTLGWTTYNTNGTIYTTGTELVIRGTYLCDLDLGLETSTGHDFWWQQYTYDRYLVPENGAMFKLMYRAP